MNINYSFKEFDDINIGDRIEFEELITPEIHYKFAKLSNDYSPIHVDKTFANSTKFKNCLGYAFYLTSLISKLYSNFLPGGTSICIKQDAKFIRPYFINQKIKIIGEVISKSESTKFVEIKTIIFNESNEKIFEGSGIVQVIWGLKDFPMYCVNKNNYIYYIDIVNALKNVGIKNGDIILVHSDISTFGKLGYIKDKNKFLNLTLEALKEVVGSNGTILMPTFTYSFTKGEVYDIDNTPSTVGILTEYFRKQDNVIRTIHPIFSFAVWGKEKEYFISNLSKDSFDSNSVFGKLHKKNAKLVFYGVSLRVCTFIHYIEQLFNIPYRYFKTFEGKIKIKDKIYNDTYTYFVRPLDKGIELDLSRFQNYLIKKQLMRKVNLGKGSILTIDSDTLVNEGIKKLKQDIYYFLNKKLINK